MSDMWTQSFSHGKCQKHDAEYWSFKPFDFRALTALSFEVFNARNHSDKRVWLVPFSGIGKLVSAQISVHLLSQGYHGLGYTGLFKKFRSAIV